MTSTSQTVHSMASEENYNQLFTFEGGDVTLIAVYKGKRVVGRVASQAMVLASRVWKKILLVQPLIGPQELVNVKQFPAGFPPLRAAINQSLDFSVDCGESLLILLQVAHLRFSGLPEELDTSGLYSLAVLCEKYECHDLIRPWSGQWISYRSSWDRYGNADRWLYIAWAFGRHPIFDSIARRVTQQVAITLPSRKPHMGTLNFDRRPMPGKIIDSILQTRTKTIQQLLHLPYTYIKQFHDSRPTLCPLKSASCDAIIYGSLVLQLSRLGLWPKKETKNCPYSIEDLAKHISGLAPISLPRILGAPDEDHSACKAPSFRDEVRRIVDAIPSPVLDCHREHMELRSRPAISQEGGGGKGPLVVVLKVSKDPRKSST